MNLFAQFLADQQRPRCHGCNSLMELSVDAVEEIRGGIECPMLCKVCANLFLVKKDFSTRDLTRKEFEKLSGHALFAQGKRLHDAIVERMIG